MIEALISPKRARREPWDLMFIAFLFVSFGVIVELVFERTLKGGMIIFTLIPSIPLLWHLIVWEERHEECEYSKYCKESCSSCKGKHHSIKRKHVPFFLYHKRLLEVFAFFFLGCVMGYTFWYCVLPAEKTAELYSEQIYHVSMIYEKIQSTTGRVTAFTGLLVSRVFSPGRFELLILNNLQVLAAIFLFSLLYGIGAVYILLWNASIIGLVVGSSFVKGGLVNGFLTFLGLLPHGIFEISAWFLTAIAGGILSVAIMRLNFDREEFKHILLDVVILSFIAFILLTIGAVIESSY